jgi:hypothetical protein
MNHNEKLQACRAIFNTCLEVLDAKGRDYSGTEDGMGNFKDFGWKGIVVRLGDKYHRLKNLTKAEAAVNESVEDTLYDTINYAALTLVMKMIEDAGMKEMQFISKQQVENIYLNIAKELP